MQLIVITPELDVANEIAIVHALFEEGLDKLHLRKPLYDATQYRHYLEKIAPHYRQKVMIHGAWELFHKQMVGGIHLRSALRGTEEGKMLLGAMPPQAISTSFHSWQEVMEEGAQYGSFFISPLFDSISKAGYKAAVLPTEIQQIRIYFEEQHPEIIGLGGITCENINMLQELGYDGAAVLGAIWQAEQPVTAFKKLIAAVKERDN